MKDHLRKRATEWNLLKTDEDRFRFLLEHKGVFALRLDNDGTYVDYIPPPGITDYDEFVEDLPELTSFYEYLGWSEGVLILLKVIEIKAECV